ncbi:MAG: hypothetical protein J5772_08745 [Clostridia bacterium]|nr:hypothetical protein [Clostridia bacterium]
MNELKRILSDKKRLFILLMIPVVCVAMFMLDRMYGNVRDGWKWMQRDVAKHQEDVEKYCSLPLDEAIALLDEEFQGSFRQTVNLKTTAHHVKDYPSYLTNVQKQAEKMAKSSIFGKDKNSFTYRNIQKTAKEFVALDGIETVFGNNRAVETFLDYRTADILYLAVIVVIVIAFFEDKKNGLVSLVRSTPKGRLKLTLSRLMILIGVSVFFTVIIYVSLLAVSFALFGGLGELGRPIQSLEWFKTCTFHMTIAQWLMTYLGAKVACGVLIGLIFWFMLSFVSNIQLSWFIVLAILGVEYAAYKLIDGQLQFSIFKYVNLFSYIYPFEPLSKYLNMNFFGYPVGVFPLLLVLFITLILLLGVGTVLLQVKRHPHGNRNILGKAIVLWNRIADFFRRRFTITGVEGYKLLILGGTIIFLAAGVFFGKKLSYVGYEYQEQDYVYLQYLGEAGGPINEDTDAYLAKARAQLELHGDIAYQFEGSLSRVESEAETIKQTAAERGFEPWLVNQTRFDNYLAKKSWTIPEWNAIVAIIFIILCVAPVFAFERQVGTERILRSTPLGRGAVFRGKYVIVFLETLILWCGIYLREWIYIATKHFSPELMAMPVQNARVLADFPIVMSLGAFLALLFALRFIGMLAAAHIVAFFSSKVNTWEKAIMLGAGALIVPAALYYFGQDWAGYLSILPSVAVTEILVTANKLNVKSLMYFFWIAVAVFLTVLVYRDWVKRSGKNN